MSLVNSDIADLIRECKLHGDDRYDDEDSFNRVDYWRNKPSFAYHPRKKCRQLHEARLNRHPEIRENDVTNIYDYRTLQPRRHHGVREFFGTKNETTNFMTIILFIIILAIIFSMV